MEIVNEMHVGVPIEEAWVLLTDIPAIAPCLPGAELTGQTGDDFEGRLRVKVGPITAEYQGSARITEMDEEARRVTLTAKGRDTRGAGNASAEIVARMSPDGAGTRVTIVTDLKISGKVAQFGRGVMADVSKKLLGQFADCIEVKLAAASGDDEAANTAGTADSADRADDGPPEALELLDVAGGAIAKRLLPLVFVVVLIVGLLTRSRRRAARSAGPRDVTGRA
jgi:carbon monoxide dehydrogenase subunit G